jgi:dihydroflavonol-4-reductase
MKVLVTGANGFLGSHLVARLAADGASVGAFIRRGSDRRKLDDLGVEVFEGDVLEPDTLVPAMQNRELVFHTAALTDSWLPDSTLIYLVNVEGTRNVCEAAKRSGVRRMIHTSSVAACGSAPPGGLADEETPWDLQRTGPYSVSKHRAERALRQCAGDSMEYVILCPHQILGPGDSTPITQGKLIKDFLNQRPVFCIEIQSQFVGVDDVVQAHVSAAENGRSKERYIIAGPEVVSLRSFYAALEEITGIEARIIWLPRLLPFAGAYLMHFIADCVTKKRPALTVGNAHLLYKRMVFSIDKARRELGFDPDDYRVALRQAVEWYR